MTTPEGIKRIYKLKGEGYQYLGGERNPGKMAPYNQWIRFCRTAGIEPDLHPARHKEQCVCDHKIYYNCWVGKKVGDQWKVKVVGCECIDKFVLHKRTCQDCGTPHKNINWDLCKECKKKRDIVAAKLSKRRKVCLDCPRKINFKPGDTYKRCYGCNQKKSG
jgi:hypothetical protein